MSEQRKNLKKCRIKIRIHSVQSSRTIHLQQDCDHLPPGNKNEILNCNVLKSFEVLCELKSLWINIWHCHIRITTSSKYLRAKKSFILLRHINPLYVPELRRSLGDYKTSIQRIGTDLWARWNVATHSTDWSILQRRSLKVPSF
jgi:hypothetical protein